MSNLRNALLGALAGFGAAGMIFKATLHHADEARHAIGPTARAIAEEVRSGEIPAGDAYTAYEATHGTKEEGNGTR